MYKKFMLCLLFSPLFFSSQSIASGADSGLNAAILGVVYDAAKTGGFYLFGWLCPSEEEILRRKYITAKSNFIKCLEGTTPESKRNEENVPTECEKTALAFIICGGVDEVFNMTRSFKPKK